MLTLILRVLFTLFKTLILRVLFTLFERKLKDTHERVLEDVCVKRRNAS